MPVLAIESSCDETAAAIYGLSPQSGASSPQLLASLVSSQIDLHRPHGGVVPELASRQHSTCLRPLVQETLGSASLSLGEIDLFAATAGPGLASSLLVGSIFAKTLALSRNKPFLAINHLEGHLLSPFIGNTQGDPGIPFPHLSLIASGGHTLLAHAKAPGDYETLGSTLDDAAGEAFDKTGKMLGLPYPGGPEIEKNAREGNPAAFSFPRALLRPKDNLDFSFSGLKTAVLYTLSSLDPQTGQAPPERIPDLCASIQQALTDVLVAKTLRAARLRHLPLVTLSGGVACNSHLRKTLAQACANEGLRFLPCPPEHTTDNAAMIAFAAWHRHAAGHSSSLSEGIQPSLPLGIH